eukprot:TRINITY_DN26969_c0_g1_i1.p1 TRINITY_DN26969_c0_g1~~TRINITY_DN26969_c0_g1_i1.p1  ORF type:complete len:233 (-),score=13.03 TRINITY_DN26969_c0_g1_i1:203-901(-)
MGDRFMERSELELPSYMKPTRTTALRHERISQDIADREDARQHYNTGMYSVQRCKPRLGPVSAYVPPVDTDIAESNVGLSHEEWLKPAQKSSPVMGSPGFGASRMQRFKPESPSSIFAHLTESDMSQPSKEKPASVVADTGMSHSKWEPQRSVGTSGQLNVGTRFDGHGSYLGRPASATVVRSSGGKKNSTERKTWAPKNALSESGCSHTSWGYTGHSARAQKLNRSTRTQS